MSSWQLCRSPRLINRRRRRKTRRSARRRSTRRRLAGLPRCPRSCRSRPLKAPRKARAARSCCPRGAKSPGREWPAWPGGLTVTWGATSDANDYNSNPGFRVKGHRGACCLTSVSILRPTVKKRRRRTAGPPPRVANSLPRWAQLLAETQRRMWGVRRAGRSTASPCPTRKNDS